MDLFGLFKRCRITILADFENCISDLRDFMRLEALRDQGSDMLRRLEIIPYTRGAGCYTRCILIVTGVINILLKRYVCCGYMSFFYLDNEFFLYDFFILWKLGLSFRDFRFF